MNKHILRSVSLLLVPCLLAGPGLADFAPRPAVSPTILDLRSSTLDPRPSPLFAIQAVTSPLLWVPPHALKPAFAVRVAALAFAAAALYKNGGGWNEASFLSATLSVTLLLGSISFFVGVGLVVLIQLDRAPMREFEDRITKRFHQEAQEVSPGMRVMMNALMAERIESKLLVPRVAVYTGSGVIGIGVWMAGTSLQAGKAGIAFPLTVMTVGAIAFGVAVGKYIQQVQAFFSPTILSTEVDLSQASHAIREFSDTTFLSAPLKEFDAQAALLQEKLLTIPLSAGLGTPGNYFLVGLNDEPLAVAKVTRRGGSELYQTLLTSDPPAAEQLRQDFDLDPGNLIKTIELFPLVPDTKWTTLSPTLLAAMHFYDLEAYFFTTPEASFFTPDMVGQPPDARARLTLTFDTFFVGGLTRKRSGAVGTSLAPPKKIDPARETRHIFIGEGGLLRGPRDHRAVGASEPTQGWLRKPNEERSRAHAGEKAMRTVRGMSDSQGPKTTPTSPAVAKGQEGKTSTASNLTRLHLNRIEGLQERMRNFQDRLNQPQASLRLEPNILDLHRRMQGFHQSFDQLSKSKSQADAGFGKHAYKLRALVFNPKRRDDVLKKRRGFAKILKEAEEFLGIYLEKTRQASEKSTSSTPVPNVLNPDKEGDHIPIGLEGILHGPRKHLEVGASDLTQGWLRKPNEERSRAHAGDRAMRTVRGMSDSQGPKTTPPPAARRPEAMPLDPTFQAMPVRSIKFAGYEFLVPRYLMPQLVRRYWFMKDGRRVYGTLSTGTKRDAFPHLELSARARDRSHVRLRFDLERDDQIRLTFENLQDPTATQSEVITGLKPLQTKSLEPYSVTRLFMDTVFGIPVSPGPDRARAQRDWLLKLDAAGLATLRKDQDRIGLNNDIFVLPLEVPSGRTFLRILSDQGTRSRFALIIDRANPDHFLVLEVDQNKNTINSATGIPLVRRGAEAPHFYSPSDFQEGRDFFKNMSRKLFVARKRPDESATDVGFTHTLGIPRAADLTFIKVAESLSLTSTGGKRAGTRGSPEAGAREASVTYPVLIADPAIERAEKLADRRDEIQAALQRRDPRFIAVPTLSDLPAFLGYATAEGYGYWKQLTGTIPASGEQTLTVYRKLTTEDDSIFFQAQSVNAEYFTLSGVTWAIGPQKGELVHFQGHITLSMLAAKYGDGRIINLPLRPKARAAFALNQSLTHSPVIHIRVPRVRVHGDQVIMDSGPTQRFRDEDQFRSEINEEILQLSSLTQKTLPAAAAPALADPPKGYGTRDRSKKLLEILVVVGGLVSMFGFSALQETVPGWILVVHALGLAAVSGIAGFGLIKAIGLFAAASAFIRKGSQPPASPDWMDFAVRSLPFTFQKGILTKRYEDSRATLLFQHDEMSGNARIRLLETRDRLLKAGIDLRVEAENTSERSETLRIDFRSSERTVHPSAWVQGLPTGSLVQVQWDASVRLLKIVLSDAAKRGLQERAFMRSGRRQRPGEWILWDWLTATGDIHVQIVSASEEASGPSTQTPVRHPVTAARYGYFDDSPPKPLLREAIKRLGRAA